MQGMVAIVKHRLLLISFIFTVIILSLVLGLFYVDYSVNRFLPHSDGTDSPLWDWDPVYLSFNLMGYEIYFDSQQLAYSNLPVVSLFAPREARIFNQILLYITENYDF